MRNLVLMFFMSIMGHVILAQKIDEYEIKNQVIIESSGYIIKAEIADSKPLKLKEELFYGSYKNKIFYNMQGGINGNALDGHYQKSDSSGHLLMEGFYSKGLKNGLWKCWYPDGQLKTLESYKMGLADGEFKQYEKDGVLIRKVVYKKGIQKEESIYNENGPSLIHRYKKGEIVKTDSIFRE